MVEIPILKTYIHTCVCRGVQLLQTIVLRVILTLAKYVCENLINVTNPSAKTILLVLLMPISNQNAYWSVVLFRHV